MKFSGVLLFVLKLASAEMKSINEELAQFGMKCSGILTPDICAELVHAALNYKILVDGQDELAKQKRGLDSSYLMQVLG